MAWGAQWTTYIMGGTGVCGWQRKSRCGVICIMAVTISPQRANLVANGDVKTGNACKKCVRRVQAYHWSAKFFTRVPNANMH